VDDAQGKVRGWERKGLERPRKETWAEEGRCVISGLVGSEPSFLHLLIDSSLPSLFPSSPHRFLPFLPPSFSPSPILSFPLSLLHSLTDSSLPSRPPSAGRSAPLG
jgi:hypothetical protein